MLRRINKTLPELILGILLFGLVIFGIGIWFVTDKLLFSTGLWLGVLLGVGMAIHLAIVIEDAVSLGQSSRVLATKSVLRYIVIGIVLFSMVIFNYGDVIAAFIGIMGLKVSAYLQPFLHKVIMKLTMYFKRR